MWWNLQFAPKLHLHNTCWISCKWSCLVGLLLEMGWPAFQAVPVGLVEMATLKMCDPPAPAFCAYGHVSGEDLYVETWVCFSPAHYPFLGWLLARVLVVHHDHRLVELHTALGNKGHVSHHVHHLLWLFGSYTAAIYMYICTSQSTAPILAGLGIVSWWPSSQWLLLVRALPSSSYDWGEGLHCPLAGDNSVKSIYSDTLRSSFFGSAGKPGIVMLVAEVLPLSAPDPTPKRRRESGTHWALSGVHRMQHVMWLSW